MSTKTIGCATCDRTQAIADAGESGGVTYDEAKSIGWRLLEKAGHHIWECPHCRKKVEEFATKQGKGLLKKIGRFFKKLFKK